MTRRTLTAATSAVAIAGLFVTAHVAPVRADVPVPTPQVDPTPAPDKAAVDLVLLLDTSNSMDGLIHQAKTQLWNIVNEAAAGEKEGEPVRLRVALFEYGNDNLPVTENYVRQIVPLTDNLDAVSAALFSLTTDGGSEYCGAVIEDALGTLDWASGDGSYRSIFIAGNEPFTQGPVDYRVAVGEAKGAASSSTPSTAARPNRARAATGPPAPPSAGASRSTSIKTASHRSFHARRTTGSWSSARS